MTAEEYAARVELLRGESARDIREGRHDPAELRARLARYFHRGLAAGFSTGELVDFLAVSSPSILDQAGLTESEGGRAMDLVSALAAGAGGL